MLKRHFLDIVIVLSIALVVGSVVMAVRSSPPSPYQPHYQQQQQAAPKPPPKQAEGEWGKFWRKTTEDPIAYFTFWLVILTAVLGLGAVTQFFFLLRSDKTSRLAAEAAKA